MGFLLPLAAAAHEVEDLVGEIAREIGMENHHIAEYGLPALGFAVIVGTLIWLLR